MRVIKDFFSALRDAFTAGWDAWTLARSNQRGFRKLKELAARRGGCGEYHKWAVHYQGGIKCQRCHTCGTTRRP